jgi:hypothetical protein
MLSQYQGMVPQQEDKILRKVGNHDESILPVTYTKNHVIAILVSGGDFTKIKEVSS